MTKQEAYRICHVYPDRELSFTHQIGNVVLTGTLKRMSADEQKTYYPFTVELEGRSQLSDGTATSNCFRRRYCSLEDAVVHIFNGWNENNAILNRYSCLEDILFKEGTK